MFIEVYLSEQSSSNICVRNSILKIQTMKDEAQQNISLVGEDSWEILSFFPVSDSY